MKKFLFILATLVTPLLILGADVRPVHAADC